MTKPEWLAGLSGSVFLFLFGNDPVSMQWLAILLCLMGADLIAGVVNALFEKSFSRRMALVGVWVKTAELFTVSMAHMIDVTGLVTGMLNVQSSVLGFLIGYELLSLIQKFKISGVPIATLLVASIVKIGGENNGE